MELDRENFERKVPSYAEPVTAEELREGEVYHSVQFADEDMLLPIVETLVFTGRETDEDGSALYCFQDIDSRQRGIKRGSPDAEGALFYLQHERHLNHIFEYDRALDELIRCSMRRETRRAKP